MDTVIAQTVGRTAMNPFLGEEEAARIQYANASGRTQYNAMMGGPSSSLNQPTAADGDNAILAVLAKIQASVTDIAVKQDNIFQRLNHLEGTRASETSGNGALAIDGERGGRSAAGPALQTAGLASTPTAGLSGGTKRKADDSNQKSGRQGRAPGMPERMSNHDSSALDHRPRSEGEGSNAMRLVTFYNASHRTDGQQIQVSRGEECSNFGDGAEGSSRGRLPAPDQTKIMTEVRANLIYAIRFPSIPQHFRYLVIREKCSLLIFKSSIVARSSPPRLSLQMQTRLQSPL